LEGTGRNNKPQTTTKRQWQCAGEASSKCIDGPAFTLKVILPGDWTVSVSQYRKSGNISSIKETVTLRFSSGSTGGYLVRIHQVQPVNILPLKDEQKVDPETGQVITLGQWTLDAIWNDYKLYADRTPCIIHHQEMSENLRMNPTLCLIKKP
jgi:hypothetical protein